jgi:hypothetical protein
VPRDVNDPALSRRCRGGQAPAITRT